LKMSESQFAGKIIPYLNEMKWNVYQEVFLGTGRNVADIIAEYNGLVWVIEVKLSLSMALLEQTMFYQGRANFISIFTPDLKPVKGHRAFNYMLSHLGVGHLVDQFGEIKVKSKPKLNRVPESSSVRKYLNDHQKVFCKAGTKGGGHWTPFKQTVKELREFVKQNPGVSMKAAIESIDHHYSSDKVAKATLSRWIRDGIVEGLFLEKRGKNILIYPKTGDIDAA